MIRGQKSLVTFVLLVVLMSGFSIPLFAQHGHGAMSGSDKQPGIRSQNKQQGMMKVGKKGAITLTSPMRVGDTVLKPGNYVFQHKVEGEDHLVIFQSAGNEVARVKCTLEPLDKKAKRTALYTHAGDGGEVILDAVAVEGENVKHVI